MGTIIPCWKKLLNSLLLAGIILSTLGVSLANAGSVDSFAAQTDNPVEFGNLEDPEDVVPFMDELISSQMRLNKIPGASVVVIQKDKVLFSKGYGVADVKGKIKVDPEKTIFKIGGLSSLPVMFALMQLVEQGKIDLDVDINQYLDKIQLPQTFEQPVTARHLLNRTGGFDVMTSIGGTVKTAKDRDPLEEYVEKVMPARIYSPGEVVNYAPDSYDILLAGYLVQKVSGVPFEEYFELNVFPLLDADRSTFRQPLPESLAVDLSTEFDLQGPYAIPMAQNYYSAHPIDNLSSTAHDMARFMMALLNNGRIGDQVVLKESSIDALMNSPFSMDERMSPQVSTWTGFKYDGIRGLMMIDFASDGFNGIFYIFPEKQVGIVLLANSFPGKVFLTLATKFSERYIPPSADAAVSAAPSTEAVSMTNEDLERFSGFYHRTGLPEKTLWKTALIQGIWETIKVAPNESGGLITRGGIGEYTYEQNWTPIKPNVFAFTGEKKTPWNFYNFDSDDYITFREDSEGRITYIYAGQTSYERMEWYEDAPLHILLWVIGLGIFLTYIYQEIILWLWKWWNIPPYEEKGKLEPSRLYYATRIVPAVAGLLGAVMIMFLLSLLLMDISWLLKYSPDQQTAILRTIMTLPMILLGIVPFVVAGAVLVWVRKYWTIKDRIYYTLAAVAAVVAVWQFSVWNVMFYQF